MLDVLVGALWVIVGVELALTAALAAYAYTVLADRFVFVKFGALTITAYRTQPRYSQAVIVNSCCRAT